MNDKTYGHYGAVLKNTAFENDAKEAYIPYCDDMSALCKEYKLGKHTVKNRIQYQPMEAQDADFSGTPTEKTFSRYKKLAEGGAGIIWVEAVSILPEGRSNPHQLMLTDDNLSEFSRLADTVKSSCFKKNGFEPLVIMQMNHSGRYSKPNGKPEPLCAYFNTDIEKEPKQIVTDDYLSSLVEPFTHTAQLAEKAGFDGIDTKACHSYLMSELLSAYEREGKYGGSFENRARLFSDVTASVDAACGTDFIRAARINVFDGYENCRYSFGKSENAMYDLAEAHRLVDIFASHSGTLLDVTMGSPYRNPDVSRPYRKGIDTPKSNAIYALSRLWRGAAEIKQAHSIAVVNTGISLLGEYSPYAAAGAVSEDMTDFVGFGRMSFAYPELAGDMLSGSFDVKKCCVCCGGCSLLKKELCESGCIIRNDYYREIFREYNRRKAK